MYLYMNVYMTPRHTLRHKRGTQLELPPQTYLYFVQLVVCAVAKGMHWYTHCLLPHL